MAEETTAATLGKKTNPFLKLMNNQWSPDRWRKSSSKKEKGQDKQTKMDKEKFKEENIWKKP